MDAYWAAPPITRTITAATVVLSLLLYSHILPFHWFLFIKSTILGLPFPQLWRLFTPFLITGGNFGLIFDPYFLFTYGKLLETGSSRFSSTSDFVTYVLFVWGIILVLAGFFLQKIVLLQALILSFIYSYAVENPSVNARLLVFNIQARYLPICVLGVSFALKGPNAVIIEITGIVAAHMYEFLAVIYPRTMVTRSLVRTPQLLRKWFDKRTDNGRSVKVKAYGIAYGHSAGANDAGRASTDSIRGSTASGWSSGFGFGNSWSDRGTGRRLGGS